METPHMCARVKHVSYVFCTCLRACVDLSVHVYVEKAALASCKPTMCMSVCAFVGPLLPGAHYSNTQGAIQLASLPRPAMCVYKWECVYTYVQYVCMYMHVRMCWAMRGQGVAD